MSSNEAVQDFLEHFGVKGIRDFSILTDGDITEITELFIKTEKGR